MVKKSGQALSFQDGYLKALDDCEQLLKESGFDDAKEIVGELRRKLEQGSEVSLYK